MATYNSSSINRDGYPRGVGVYPIKVIGTINIASNTTLGSGVPDTLPICYIPQNSFLSDFKIGFPALGTSVGLKLVDTLSSVTTYVAVLTQGAAGGVVTWGNAAVADQAKLGIVYGGTARAIGTTGAQVVVWTSGVQLVLSVITSGSATTGASAINITYMVEWSPGYDFGV